MKNKCGSDSDDLVLLNEQEEPTEVCGCQVAIFAAWHLQHSTSQQNL